MKFMTTLTFCLMFVFSANAQQIKIESKYHAANRAAGYCGHCCVETIALHLGYNKASGHVAKIYALNGEYGGGVTEENMCEMLRGYGMRYSREYRDTFKYDWLKWAVKEGFPCIVTIMPPGGTDYLPFGNHAVVLVGIDDETVWLVDSNFPGKVRTLSLRAFKERWLGSLIMVYTKP